jgi:hypothetical protein
MQGAPDMTYRPRSVLSFQFKSRPRRRLLWEKVVYRLWFDYAKVSPRGVPAEFGDLSAFNDFEEWWRHPSYGFELFCEPPNEQPLLKVVQSITDGEELGVIYVRVNLNEEPERLKRSFDSILRKQQEGLSLEPKSEARFHPSMPQRHMKLSAWRQDLENWKSREGGMSRRDIFRARYRSIDPSEDQLRVISREFQRAKKMFQSIERGTFP